ncbi:hypothetical protein [Sphingomonas sp. NFR15]|nr:hypothetical protein [Sphingomonas sp. NFR15]SDA14753.1 hypothetical protein SAMN03159340_00589 [Sphingomonas sp. NFR15]
MTTQTNTAAVSLIKRVDLTKRAPIAMPIIATVAMGARPARRPRHG